MVYPNLYPIIQPIVPYIPNFANGKNINTQVLTSVILAILFLGCSILLGWILTNIIKNRGYVCSRPWIVSIVGIVAFSLYLRYGITATAIQGVFLLALLIYASCSDLTDHTSDDCVWICVLALAVGNIQKLGIVSMLIGAAIVFLPQIAMAFMPRCRTLGGADIKLATATAFLLGAWRGTVAFLMGLLGAVIFMIIYNKVKGRKKDMAFALIPFLSASTMIVYLI